MLTALEVSDFANVSHALLELPEEGYCALTGETGVGKSILVDALALASGARLDRDFVRSGRDRAELSASFDVGGNPAALEWLARNGMEDDGGELVVRRGIDRNRRSRAHVNGRAATLAQLGEIVGTLVGICGQHEHLRLRDAARRRELLDRSAKAQGRAAAVSAACEKWKDACAALEEAKKGAEAARGRIGEIEGFLAEVDMLGLTEQRWEEESGLLAKQGNVAEIGELHRAVGEGIGALEGGLSGIKPAAARLAELLPDAKAVSDQVRDLSILASDLSRDHARLGESTGEVDRESLERAEAFVSEAHRLSRKHRAVGPPELIALADRMRKELEEIGSADVGAAERKVAEALGRYEAAAKKLTAARRKEARSLSGRVRNTLRQLALPHARFEIALDPRDAPSRHGAEDVAFRFAARKTMDMSELGEVASGGELSRTSLALFAEAGGDGSKDMVFDEVDTGIGGKTAAHVGRLLAELGAGRLVLCVTHLPQVAAAARHHWIVRTDEEGLAALEFAEGKVREEEIARMLAGRRVTEASRVNAREILATASG